MGYTVVKSFERGLDKRRLIDTTEAGGLIDAKNCHITRGGEVEKRAAFSVVATLPATTVGFYVMPGKIYHTWGTAATAPAGMPAGAVYHSIPEDSGAVLEAILCVEEFSKKLYVIAQYAGGIIRHWWDDVMVRTYIAPTPIIIDEGGAPGGEGDPPDTGESGAKPKGTCNMYNPIQPANVTGPYPAYVFAIWLLKPGSKFKFTGSAIDAWSIIATDGVDSQGKPFKATGGLVPAGAESNIATTVAKFINEFTGGTSPVEVSASASGTQLTIWVEDVGTTYNGWSIYLNVNSNIFPGYTMVLGGGLTRTTESMLSTKWPDTLDVEDADTPMMLGTYALAHDLKMYTVNGSKLHISMQKNPMRWDDNKDAIGTDEVQMDMVAEGTPLLISMSDYQDSVALFGLRHILIWKMEADPVANRKRQTLHKTGLVAPHAQTPYGEGDVMYLDRTGIRSLRTRSGVDEAYSEDLGTPIDSLVRTKIKATAVETRFLKFWAEVEPLSGRLWMALHDVIYVLSYYPGTRIAAWSYYDATSHPVDYMNSADDIVFWRSVNDIIAYGGLTGEVYDNTEATVRVPYIDAGKPASAKNWTGVDAAVSGTWQIKSSFDPTVPAALDLIANLTKSTYQQQKIALNGESPAISLEFKTSFVGPATLGNAALHYTDSTAD